MAVGGLVIGAGALWLLSQLGKSAPKQQTPAGLDLLKLIPTIIPTNPATLSQKVLGGSGTEVLLKAISLFVGLAGTIAAAGVAAGPAAVIAGVVLVVFIAAVVIVSAVVQNNEWERAAMAKGPAGLADDYVKLGISIGNAVAQSMIDPGAPAGVPPEVALAWPTVARAWSAVYAANIITGYNQVSYGCWGAGAPNDYWEQRAMYLQPAAMVSVEQRISAGIMLPSELTVLAQFNTQARRQAQQWGVQYGRILWAYLCSRGSMVEPWQTQWSFVAARHESVGQAVPGAAVWSPLLGTNLMIYGLGKLNVPPGEVQNFDEDGQPINPYLISLGSTVTFLGAGAARLFRTAKTIAYPYMVDWLASSDSTLVVFSAPDSSKPASFAGGLSAYAGRRALGNRFALMSRGRYGR